MTQVCLYHDEAEEGDLPRVCIRCGDPDAEFETRHFVWYPMLAGPLLRLFMSRRVCASCRCAGGTAAG